MENYQPPAKRLKYFLRSTARANQQKLGLLDINTYCIFQIFDHLDVIDLAMIADTNKQLRALAQDHFRVKCGEVDLHAIDKSRKGRKHFIEESKVFRNFGNYISDLSICGGCANKTIFKLIKKYCKPKILTRLHLKFMAINKFNMKTLNPFFGNLEFLEIYDCLIQDRAVFPNAFRSLKSLELAKCLGETIIYTLIRNYFPQLEKLSIRFQCEVDHDDFCRFIQRHKHLKTLSFDEDNYISSETIKCIGKTLTRLEHFVLKGDIVMDDVDFRQAIVPFGSIKSLKKIILDCNHCPAENLFEAFVANNIGIEHMHLINVNFDEKTQMHLKSLKTIKTLIFEFVDHLNTQRYISIAEHLPLLGEFHLVCPKPISDESIKSLLFKSRELSVLQIETPELIISNRVYSNMLNIIKNRHKVIAIEIRVPKGSGQIVVPIDKIKANQKWIRFVELELSKSNSDEYDEKFDDEYHEEPAGEFYVHYYDSY